MKTSMYGYRNAFLLFLVALSVSLLVVGCSDDETDVVGGGEAELSLNGIILNPKSAGLADTVLVTADLTASFQDPGSFATIKWVATEGTLLEDNEQTVRWVAPGMSTRVRLTVTATNSVSSVTLSTDIFVGTPIKIVPSYAGEFHMLASGDQFLYLRSVVEPSGAGFAGYGVYQYTGAASIPVIDGDTLGWNYVFTADLTTAARTFEGRLIGGDILAPSNVWIDDLLAQNSTEITADGKPDSPRHDRFVYPYFTPLGDKLVYEAFRPNYQQGDVDTFDIEIYDVATKQTINITEAHGENRRNFFPSVSSDGDWLVFVSDRLVLNQWELYGLRFDGVMTDSNSTVRLTDTDGLIAGGTPLTLTSPRKTWNPNPSIPVLAIIGNDGELRLVETNATSATTANATDVGTAISSMVWSPSGQMLAVAARVQGSGGISNNVLFTVTTDGVATERHRVSSRDEIGDMTWSPNEAFLVYRVTRGGSTWLEVMDMVGNTGWLKPIILTATSDEGEIEDYRALMSTSSAYNANNVVYYLLFDGVTPSINMLDISGAIPSP